MRHPRTVAKVHRSRIGRSPDGHPSSTWGVHDSAMSRLRSWAARRLDRWASAFVMEATCDDGTRLLIGLDPTLHGACAVTAVANDEANDLARLRVPDDLRDLVP